MNYIEFTLTLLPGADPEIITALLAGSGFESFVEKGEERLLLGYVREEDFDRDQIIPLLEELVAKGWLTCRYETIPERNWNAEWESSYDLVVIDGKCTVRAPFHAPVPGVPFDIVIEPRMSFGTAHHETTALMISALLNEDLKGKRVLDMGCGTGVLAILANRMGAESVVAIDNDEWAFGNAVDNRQKNNAMKVEVIRGEAADIPDPAYDLIAANINRNTLAADIPAYARALRDQGTLLVSGFYAEDLPSLKEVAAGAGLNLVSSTEKNRWTIGKFVK